jgi:short-subunit dehydrogenase
VNAVVVGASAGLGRALAEGLARRGHDLVVAASDERDLAAIASDLRIRHQVRVIPVPIDLGGGAADVNRLLEAARSLGGVDALLLPIGWTAPADCVSLDLEIADRLVRTNFLSVVAIVKLLLPELQRRRRSSLVGFGSVADARGRGANLVYAAAKRALRSYFEGLRHACAGSPVRVRFYVLGYLDTNLAFGRRTLLRRADPVATADRVLRELGREGVVYHPRAWRLLSLTLSLAPWFLFRRLKA